MSSTIHPLDELADRLTAGATVTRDDALSVLTATDLVRIGVVGEAARVRATGREITFGRVALVDAAEGAVDPGDAGEVRILGRPASADAALARVAAVAAGARGLAVTGFSLADLIELAGHDHLVLADLAGALREAGLEAVAETPVDRLGESDHAIEILRAVHHGGLATWRLTVDEAPLERRLQLIDLAADLHRETGSAVKVFAPLPRLDPVETPSTGYDDVRTIAVARLRLPNTMRVQVDWPLYGPKLAQVAVAYGAGDIDGISAVDDPDLGPRRAARADIIRQIEAAGGRAVERDGRHDPRS